MREKVRKCVIITSGILGGMSFLYLVGMVSQILANYRVWLKEDGISGREVMKPPDRDFFVCIRHVFTVQGLKSLAFVLLTGISIYLYVRWHDRFDGNRYDERGFKTSSTGTYGTAGWMSDKEMREELEVAAIDKAEGVILGERDGKAVCMPRNTRLNRHIAVFGASGTMKSRAVIRNALFQALRRGESVVITDPKAELFGDTAELYRKNGYEVKVFNLVEPEHGDSWNCMADLNGNTLMAQVLTNVIIGNTSSGKGDHFWDNGEGNLLKALILYIDLDRTRSAEEKNLPAVYHMLTHYTESQLSAVFNKLPMNHPARAPFNLFAQSSDTVKAGIISGLGTRLQVIQNRDVCSIINRSDIDLSKPGKEKCAYYIILSDQDTTMAFLSSLFFSFLFIKLTRYADSRPERRCDVPVNLILDEFNNVGRIGGAADGSDFARTLSVIRSRDIRVMLAVQSLGQLQNRYPNNLWSEIVGNCDIQLMLGCTDDVTAKYFSDRSGEMSIEVETTMTTRQTIAVAQVIPQYRQSKGEGRRKLLTPDEVLRLPNTELLCIIRGRNILRLNKLDYTKHPVSRELRRISVVDYRPAHSMEASDQPERMSDRYAHQTGTVQDRASPHQTEAEQDRTGLRKTGTEQDRTGLRKTGTEQDRTSPHQTGTEQNRNNSHQTGMEQNRNNSHKSGTEQNSSASSQNGVPDHSAPHETGIKSAGEDSQPTVCSEPNARKAPKKRALYISENPPVDF